MSDNSLVAYFLDHPECIDSTAKSSVSKFPTLVGLQQSSYLPGDYWEIPELFRNFMLS